MLLGATGGKALWYLTRGTGLVALLLLTASILLGIVEVRRWQSRAWPRFVTAGLHRNLSLLAVAFVAVHVATTVIDGFAPIGWLDAIIPFHSPYRPIWLGLGAVAFDLMLALVVTSLVRGRMGYRWWRAVHWAAYACWPVALVHGLGTGTDLRAGWATALYGLCLVTVVVALWWRLAQAWREAPDAASGSGTVVGTIVAAALTSVIVPAVIVAWVVTGPLRPGWSRRAGTPSRTHAAAVGVPTRGPAEPS
jgi:methionine sulfoxide reductase heme-binding subunit